MFVYCYITSCFRCILIHVVHVGKVIIPDKLCFDTMAHCLKKTPAARLSSMWDRQVLDFLGEGFQITVHGANMGPTWVLSAPDGPHVGPLTLLSGMSRTCGSSLKRNGR